jgi:hypothetical protein
MTLKWGCELVLAAAICCFPHSPPTEITSLYGYCVLHSNTAVSPTQTCGKEKNDAKKLIWEENESFFLV